MPREARFSNAALWTLTGVVVAIAGLMYLAAGPMPADAELRLRHLQLYADVLKTLVAGVFVAVLVVLIPHSLNEAKYRFEQRRESRQAYSEAKTGVVYLPYRLAVLDYGEAIALIEGVHVKKHVAETYDELTDHVQGKTVREWSDELFNELQRLKKVVGDDHDVWSRQSPQERLSRLRRRRRRRRRVNPSAP